MISSADKKRICIYIYLTILLDYLQMVRVQ